MNCDSFYFTADFLYWRSENHGFSYAYELQESSLIIPDNVGKVLRVDPEWDPGFRVGAGWTTTYDFWDVYLNYTWFHNDSNESKSSTEGFAPLWPVTTADLFGTVSANTNFTLNMGDLEVGRLVYLTKTIAIRPHLGARGGTLHQKFNSTFAGVISSDDDQQTFSGQNNYWGVGPRTGLNGEWHLDQGFSILGKLAGALIYGQNKSHSNTNHIAAGGTASGTLRHHKDKFYQLVPNMQLLLGFQWQTCFWCEKMFFKMSAAWETNYWWDQFNLPTSLTSFQAPLPTVGNQPLTMEGLTVNVEWDF